MGIKALSEYLRVLREERGLSVLQVCNEVGTSQSYLWKLENAKLKQPGVYLLFAVTDVIEGDIQDVKKLLLSEKDNPSYGKEIALRRLEGIQEEQEDPLEDIDTVMSTIAKIMRNKSKLAKLAAFCEGLKD
jgi:transcriptional regulator with XRE-family HTH domain